jgi:hypothetical protein
MHNLLPLLLAGNYCTALRVGVDFDQAPLLFFHDFDYTVLTNGYTLSSLLGCRVKAIASESAA